MPFINIFLSSFCFFPVESKLEITALLRLSRKVLVWWIMLHVMKLKGKKKKVNNVFREKSFHSKKLDVNLFVSLRTHPYNHKITVPITFEEGDPAHGKGVGTRRSLMFLPTQTIL